MILNLTKHLLIISLFSFLSLTGCSNQNNESLEEDKSTLRLFATFSATDSGLLDVLIPVFEHKYNINVIVESKASGEVLQVAREGVADVVMVHARDEENKFIMEGFGINRCNVMFNDFVLLGPPEDPAKIGTHIDIISAFKAISDQRASFISRGDNSGNHIRELELWKLSGIKHNDGWYKKSKKGMKDTLISASKQKAYVLSDRSTYLFNQKALDLSIIIEGDKLLFNPYGIIAVNPAKFPGVNFSAAMQFIDYITSAEGQEIIYGYGRLRFGKSLFTPFGIKE